MIIEKELIINKSIDNAWQILGHGFADVHIWASVVNHSAGSGNTFNGASCSERGCDIAGMGKMKEKLLQFSNEQYSLCYEYSEGVPSMVKYATNTWMLTSLGQDKTKLNMKMDITLGGLIGMIMQPMMKLKMSKMGNTLIKDFKYYVENGRPSEAKIKAMKKYKG